MSRGERVIATLLLVGMVLLFLVPYTFFIIPPGHVGVLYRLFTIGTETHFVFPEGLGVKWPWNRVYKYDVRIQARNEDVHGLSEDGLSMGIEATVLFHPVAPLAGLLHKEIGTDYVERLVRPLTIGAIRTTIGKYGPHDLYRTSVDVLEQQILSQLELASTATGLIKYQSVIVRNVELPALLNEAITRKLTEDQNAQAYNYLITQAEKEAERKRIEATGIERFYAIVANALTPPLLTWRGIEATVELARSNNTKIVIVGGGKDQLPLILGGDLAAPAAPLAPSPSISASSLPALSSLGGGKDQALSIGPEMPTTRSSSAGAKSGGGQASSGSAKPTRDNNLRTQGTEPRGQ